MPLCTLTSSTLGRTSMSPLWLMMTRCPDLLKRKMNLGAFATMSYSNQQLTLSHVTTTLIEHSAFALR